MAKGGGKKGSAPAPGKKGPRRGNVVSVKPVDFDDDVSDDEELLNKQKDAFASRKDKVSLNVDEDDSGDEFDEEAVMGLGSSSDEDSGDEDEDGDEDEELDEDDIIEAALQRGGKAAKLAQLAKDVGRKVKLQRGEESDEEDEEGGEGQRKARKAGDEEDDGGALAWGANKREYYDADSEELDDEEAQKEEEEEVKRMERARATRLSAADFGLDEEEEDEEGESEEEEEEEDTMEAAAKAVSGGKAKDKGKAKGSTMEVEAVEKDLGALGEGEREAALLADAPELLALLDDLRGAVEEVRHRTGPLLQEVRSGKLATPGGLSYLEAKHLLLLQYAAHITFYLMLKAEGRPVRDHPVIHRLVELRAYLEKIRPIDKHMGYQIEKLLRAARAAKESEARAGGRGAAAGDDEEAGAGAGGALDETAFGPRPSQLAARAGSAAAAGGDDRDGAARRQRGSLSERGAGGDGVYRPPKLNPVSMEFDEDRRRGKAARDEARMVSAQARRASRSEEVAALAAELAGAPEELRDTLPGFDSMGALKMRHKLEARQAEEEDIMTRVPLSREQVKALKAARRQGFSAAATLGGDFGDEVAGLVQAGNAGGKAGAGLADLFSQQKVSQKFGAELARPTARGGDEDLPRRANLQDRRAAFDSLAAKRAAAAAGSDDDDGAGEYDASGGARGGKRRKGAAGEEDDFYVHAKETADLRKRQREADHRAPALFPPLPDQEAGGRARGITQTIEKNRGLTPHRRKDLKNPRKKHRIKYAEAVVRRKGAVQDVGARRASGEGPSAYGGEATGIKSRIAKSRRL